MQTSQLNYKPYVLSCPTCFAPCVLSCPMCLELYVLSCPTSLVSNVLSYPRASFLTCSRALRALVPYVSHALRAFVPHVSRVLRALVPHVPCALRASCFMCFVPYVFSCLTWLTCCCTSRVLCLAYSRAARVSNSTCSCAPRPSVASGVSCLTCSYASHFL